MLTMDIMETIPMPLDLTGSPVGPYLTHLETNFHVSICSYEPQPNGNTKVAFQGTTENIIKMLTKDFYIPWDDCEEYIEKRYDALPHYIDIIVFSELLITNGWKETTAKLDGYTSPYEFTALYQKNISGKDYEIVIPIIKAFPDIHLYENDNGNKKPNNSFLSNDQMLRFHHAVKYLNTLEKD